MPDLEESSVYEPGIYQLETTDPVMGGVNGVDNLQAKQLANRTVWLKDKTDSLESDVILVRSSASQAISANLFNIFDWNVVDRNDNGILLTSAGGLINVPAGYSYARVTGSYVYNHTTTAGGISGGGLLVNGVENSLYIASANNLANSNIAAVIQGTFVTALVPVSAGDTLGMYLFHQTYAATLWPLINWLQIEFFK
jgi:hypothetical protein